jgi:hypothetical protein
MENWALTFGWDVHGVDHVGPKQAQSYLHPRKEMLHITLNLCSIQITA